MVELWQVWVWLHDIKIDITTRIMIGTRFYGGIIVGMVGISGPGARYGGKYIDMKILCYI